MAGLQCRPEVRTMLTTRRQAWKKLVWSRSVVVIALVTLFLSTVTFWWDELFPELGRPHLAAIVHAIHWWYWAIGGLVVILVLVVEEALKVVNESEDRLEDARKASRLPNISIVLHLMSIGGNPATSNMRVLTIDRK